MALTSTLFTGLSGLDVNQTKLNVVGNNIANVNTVAFKGSRVLFKPQFYVTDADGSPPSGDFGGTNPSQRGLGAVVASIQKDFSPGTIEPTGRPTDMAIDGDGFFVVQSNQQKFTRDGSFVLNSANQLVTNAGDFVQGYGVDANFNIVPGQLQNITIPLGALTAAKQTENVMLKGTLNANGDEANGASILLSQALTVVNGASKPDGTTALTSLAAASDNSTPLFVNGDVITLKSEKAGHDLPDATFIVGSTGSTVNDLMNFLQGAAGINTAVPDDGDAATPTPGAALEDDSSGANNVHIAATGNLGLENALALTLENRRGGVIMPSLAFADGTNAAGIASNASGESVRTSIQVYDSLGTPLMVTITSVLESTSNTGNTWRFYAESGDDTDTNLALGTGTLTFSPEGKLIDSTGTTIRIDRDNTGATTPMNVTLNFGAVRQLTSAASSLATQEQDGFPIGTLDSFAVGADGRITGSFNNGLTRTLGRVAIATFNNSEGLVDKGGNMYVPGPSSGVAVITSPLSMGAGSIRSGALELSNVDLSEEFINLIVASTGFSAASRVITTSDRLLTELLNSSR